MITSLSPSSLELYATCPYCFWLKINGEKQVASPAMQWGSGLHHAIEMYHKNPEFNFGEVDLDFVDYLHEYMQLYDQKYEICEEFWSLPLLDTGITFRLKADLVKDNYIIDHKTSARPYTQEFVDSHRQLTAYSWAYRKLYHREESGIKINLFNTNPKHDGPLLEVIETIRTDYSSWIAWVKNILQGIESDRFEPNMGAKWHNFPLCPGYKEPE